MAELQIPVPKGKGFLTLDTDRIPEHVYKEFLIQGAKAVLGRGMTKITKETYPKPEELQAAAMAKATATLEDCYNGKIKITGAKADKISGVVMTEARRLARNLVKDEMKKQGIKVSYVEASEITKAANALITANPELVDEARKSLAERDQKAAQVKEALAAVAGGIQISEKKKAKVEAEKAKAKEVLSAKQAGKIAPRIKPQATA